MGKLSFFKKGIVIKKGYIVLSLVIFIATIVINILVDPNSLKVDRWSAMEVTIENILNGIYPYNKLDHLGQTSSNLPGLSLLGFPFYFLGDVGYLQVFTFCVFSSWIFISKRKEVEKLLILIFLVLSPAYWWEVFVKSDLMSNLLLLVVFIDCWKESFNKNTFEKSLLLGVVIGFFVMTRGVVLIPLTIMLFHEFVKATFEQKIWFLLGVVSSVLVISLPIILSLEDFNTVIENNPFNHQTKYAPKLLIICSLVVPLLLSRKFSTSMPIFRLSTYVLTGLLLTTFMLNIFQEGVWKNIYGKAFDLSYLGMIIPFLLLSLSSLNSRSVSIQVEG
ncbi:hypothetical protein [Tenacibaculum xiamenense]|uniref:hypothetical protein n=1 Tax=Tenacibaculum xiamenense TaxID=1261553 RepID=UPI0038B51D84